MADENDQISQEEIERMLRGTAGSGPVGSDAPSPGLTQAMGVPGRSDPPPGAPSASREKEAPPQARPAASPAPPVVEEADKRLGQEDIAKLLDEAGRLSAPAPKPAPHTDKVGPDLLLPGEGSVLPGDMDLLLSQAERALSSIESGAAPDLPPEVTAFSLEELSGAPCSTESATLDLIRDVELDLRIELGRTHMYLEDVLKLRRGSVVPLDKLAGDPVDIFVNGRLIARGEVLVLNDSFCVRVAELIAGAKPAA
jgi:flagellar motor switch protein FliN/FliY